MRRGSFKRLGIDPELPALERSPAGSLLIEQESLELLNRQDRAAILQRISQGMGCVVLLGPIRVRDHPGAVATPKIKELISAAEKLSQPGRGRVFAVMNIEQHPLWSHGTLGIETVYSDMLQAIYRSQGTPPVDVRAGVRPLQPVANATWTATVYGRGTSVRVRVFRDIPTNYSGRLWTALAMSLTRSLSPKARRRPASAATVYPGAAWTAQMSPLPSWKRVLLRAQMLDERKRVLGWSLRSLDRHVAG